MAEPVSLHPLLATRWSPTAFDPEHVVSDDELESLLEAARWAPSAGNSQPWAFVVGRRGDDTHRELVAALAASSRRWAPEAGLLLGNLAHRFVVGTDWEHSEFALYDLGQAVAHLTVQAAALDLQVRQFRAFDRRRLTERFGIADHWQLTTLSAVGRAAGPPPGRPDPARERRARPDLLWPAAGEEPT